MLVNYLPLGDKVLKAVSFIDFQGCYNDLVANIEIFNDRFKVFDKDELQEKVYAQVLALKTYGFHKYKNSKDDSVYVIWDNIAKTQKYNDLCKLAKLALSLPTSSSDIEQGFSVLKLYRTDQRNSLREETLDGLMLVKEEFKDQDEIVIKQAIIDIYNQIYNPPSPPQPNTTTFHLIIPTRLKKRKKVMTDKHDAHQEIMRTQFENNDHEAGNEAESEESEDETSFIEENENVSPQLKKVKTEQPQ